MNQINHFGNERFEFGACSEGTVMWIELELKLGRFHEPGSPPLPAKPSEQVTYVN